MGKTLEDYPEELKV